MRRLASLWPALISALLLLTAFPPLRLSLLVFVALAPLFRALSQASGRRGLALGYAFGLVYMAAQMHWLQPFVARWTGSLALSLLPWLMAAAIGALYFALFGWLATRCFARGLPWLVPLVWAGVEVFRSYLPALAFPWGLLATPLWHLPVLTQGAYFGSVFLVSAWAALASLALALWMEGAGFARLRGLAIAFAFGGMLSLVRFSADEPAQTMVVTVGQPGVDLAFGDEAAEAELLRKAIQSLQESARINGSELLVLPEAIAREEVNGIPVTPFPLDRDVAVLFGGKRGSDRVFQTAYAYDGGWTHADKTRLVIFGEYVPGRNWIPFLSAFELPQGDLSPGLSVEAVHVRGTKIGPLLCFEALFPDLAYRQALNGSRMLAVLSIDDWYMGTTAPEQLMAASVWRAVETGLPLVRSASLGHTFAVDGHGRMLAEAPLRRTVPLRVEVPVPMQARPFLLYPVAPFAFLAAAAAALALPWLPLRKAKAQ